MKGSVKEPIISIISFFCPSLNGDLLPVFSLLVEGECQILHFSVFKIAVFLQNETNSIIWLVY